MTLPLLLLMIVIFMIHPGRARSAHNRLLLDGLYRMLSRTTSTSQGRRVPFFLGSLGFLFFICLSWRYELVA